MDSAIEDIGLARTVVSESLLVAQASREFDNSSSEQSLELPSGLPSSFAVELDVDGEHLTLELKKHSVYGENTKFLLDDGSGSLVELDPGLDRTYLGQVAGRPGQVVGAVLSPSGLFASIVRPGETSVVIEPSATSGDRSLHLVNIGSEESEDGHDHEETLDEVLRSIAPIETSLESTAPVMAAAASGSTATLPPSQVIDYREYEIGVEIGSRSFNSDTYNSNLATAQASAATTVANMDARYLHGAGMKFRLGTVIIRTDNATDPLRDDVLNSATSSSALSAFRNYWNSHPGEVGTTHDLAVYHVKASPSGLAYVGGFGGSSKYALTGGNGTTSWADGTLVHEFGHNLNLRHNNDSGLFYESKPRSNPNSAGGSDVFVSVMNGGGDHNIGRLSTEEAEVVLAEKRNHLSVGDVISPANETQVKPFGKYDRAFVADGPKTIDVIANDYDANNDVLDSQIRDTVSQAGGTISLSMGTGPGGRNQLIYTPPANFSGSDFFHYTVVDSTGRSDWGAVYVDVEGPQTVDLSRTSYQYDLGPRDSVVFSGGGGYELISPETFGELGFTIVPNANNIVVEARDRGTGTGENDINRDHIRLRGPAEFHHRLADGTYEILFTLNDAIEITDPVRLTAEDSVTLTTARLDPGQQTNYTLRDVIVNDGELNIDIENLGFSANISRIVITRTGEAPTIVDLNQTLFQYDVGARDSVLFSSLYERLPADSFGDISFVGGNPQDFDRDIASGVNNINRDGVLATGMTTLNHKLASGLWKVLVNVGDRDFARDDIRILAEGAVYASDIDRDAGQFGPNIIFNVPVIDGELNLRLEDLGGVNDQISVTRINLERVGNADTIAPTITSVVRWDPSQALTEADQLRYRVTFSEPVVNVDPPDFRVVGSSAVVSSVVAVQGTGEPVYDVIVGGGNLASYNGNVAIETRSTNDIQDATGNALSTASPSPNESYVLDNIQPQVTGVTINDGGNSRSQITSVTVAFDQLIDHAMLTGAFALTNLSTAAQVGSVSVSAIDDGNTQTTQATLTFDGASTISRQGVGRLANSLGDGIYELKIDANAVRRSDTQKTMAADHVFGGQSAGQPTVDEFYRLFGDVNGSHQVDLSDFAMFRGAFGEAQSSIAGAALDANGDGNVNLIDFAGFRGAFGEGL